MSFLKYSRCILGSFARKTWQNGAGGIYITSVRPFYEPYRKGDKKYEVEDKRTYIELVKEGFPLLKGEVKLWIDEMKEGFAMDPKLFVPGDTDIIWAFNSQEDVNKWAKVSDKDNNDGFSHCNFELSKDKKGLFHGYLDTQLPKDGMIYKAGYCNISSMKAKKSFMRSTYWDWTMFTHLVLNIRGDGRSYMINIMTTGHYDVTWQDMYNFVLYTRGGPYWQTVKIPFSKFVFSNKGRIQDKQIQLPQNKIANLGITCADNISGAFQLEIDYIGIHFDASHKEDFAYELYQTGKYQVY